MSQMTPRHLLSIDSLTRSELLNLVAEGRSAKAEPDAWAARLVGRQIALVFEKPSTRTRVSFEVAVSSSGGHALVLRGDELQLGRGETIEDTGRVLSRLVDAIVLRTFSQDRLERLADAASVPVVNALSDDEHPCQCLADLQTIAEKRGDLEGTTLAYIGDGNNVAHSLLLGSALAGMHVRVAAPSGYEPWPRIVARARELAAERGTEVIVTHDPGAAAEGAHVIYTDVWTSMGKDEEADARRAALERYRVDEELVSLGARDVIVMHCLPAHRGEEITAAVIDGPRSVVWEQAENRLHAQKALLAWLLNP